MSAVCGLPSTLFDLFLESNVMIVANFEIWKHTCYVSLQSCFARFSLAHLRRCVLLFYLVEPDYLSNILTFWEMHFLAVLPGDFTDATHICSYGAGIRWWLT